MNIFLNFALLRSDDDEHFCVSEQIPHLHSVRFGMTVNWGIMGRKGEKAALFHLFSFLPPHKSRHSERSEESPHLSNKYYFKKTPIFASETAKKATMKKGGYVYIMTNKNKTTLYIGVTNDICRRVYEHKYHIVKNSFTDTYNLEYCIYYEEFPDINSAIAREKQLKKWNRAKKVALINAMNPEWKTLL